jgi:NAD(P)-dependent dehydrogenase (short-subunit alcohol dehydrogenase family)
MTDRYVTLHNPANNAGPGDHRRTALQVVEDQNLLDAWFDKVVLITGCTSGIGIETARAMKATGAKVYVTGRSLSKGNEILSSLLEPGRFELLELKLDSLASVRACAAAFQARETKLNILINNAGVMAIPTRTTTEDNFETQFGTNHLGHFLLFQLLKPQLLAGSTPDFHSRVINLTSVGHRYSPVLVDDLNLSAAGAYQQWPAYGHSKTAVIWMANEVERRYGNRGAASSDEKPSIHGLSVAPGGIRSGLQKHVPEFEAMWEIPEVKRAEKNVEQGAATTVWAAVEKGLEGKGALYLDDCMVASQMKEGAELADPGYAGWAFDKEGARRLWRESCGLVGVQEED